MRWLAKQDVNLVLLNWNGNLLSNCLVKDPKNGELRVRQYANYLDSKKRYYIASEIVAEKILKSLELLTELSRYYNIDISATKKACEAGLKNTELTAEKQLAYNESDIYLMSMDKDKKFELNNKKRLKIDGKRHFLSPEKSPEKGEYDINKLLMYEGKISMIYWENLRLIFQ